MKLKNWMALLLMAAVLFSFAACNKDTSEKEESSSASSVPEIDPNYPVALDGEIHIPARPKTVVSLSPALTEILYELGAGDRIEGVSDYCDYPAAVEGTTRCGSAQTPNLKEIELLSPDVVFSSAPLSQQDTIAIQQMGAQVVVLRHAESMEELEKIYITAATVLDGLVDGDKNGKETFAPLKDGYHTLEYEGQRIADQLNGIYLRGRPLLIATGDTFEGQLLEMIGINNDAKEYTNWSYPEDQAANLYPKIIFYDRSVGMDYLKSTKIYNTTDAVKQERSYEVDAILFERQSARMLEQLTEMMKVAYPELAHNIDAPSVPTQPESSESSSEEDDEVLNLDDATQIH